MKVQAMFIGEDGSLGYRKGRSYELTIIGNAIQTPRPCPYSVAGFLRNWIVIAVEGVHYPEGDK